MISFIVKFWTHRSSILHQYIVTLMSKWRYTMRINLNIAIGETCFAYVMHEVEVHNSYSFRRNVSSLFLFLLFISKEIHECTIQLQYKSDHLNGWHISLPPVPTFDCIATYLTHRPPIYYASNPLYQALCHRSGV